jgi:hypothetical protein
MEGLKPFKYFFRINGAEYELPQAPDGWEDTTATWQRDNTYWAVLREFSLPYNYVLSAANYLRRVLFTQGIDADCELVVYKLNRTFETYEIEYEGAIDFSEAEDSRDTFEVNIMQKGLDAKLKALKNINFDLDFTDAVDVEIPGVDLIEYANSFISGVYVGSFFNRVMTFGTLVSTFDIPLGTFNAFSQTEETAFSFDFTTYSNFFLEVLIAKNLQITGAFNATLKNGIVNNQKAYVNIYICDSSVATGGNKTLLYTSINEPINTEVTRVINFSTNILGVVGRKYFLIVESSIFGNTLSIYPEFTVNEATIRVSAASTSETVIAKALKPATLLDKIIKKISQDGAIQSNLLDKLPILITSGEAIRGLVNPKIKTSFDDFFKSINALKNIGLDIVGNTAIIEQKSFFLRQSVQIADVGEVKEIKIKPYTEQLGSGIKVGYKDNNYEVENGRFEFNSEQQWETTSKRVNKIIDITSAYRADQFGIEEMRLKQLAASTDNQTATDSKDDNTIFMLYIKPEPIDDVFRLELGEDYDEVTGTVSRTSTYNLALSPKNNLLNHAPFIASSFFGINENGNISFASSTKNAELSTKKDGVLIVEKEPLYIKTITDRLFLPFIVSFKAAYPKNIQSLIATNKYGHIKFYYKGNAYKGYIMELSIDLTKNSEQEFKLLLTPDNNLTTLFNFVL